jgi:hypothetical protein
MLRREAVDDRRPQESSVAKNGNPPSTLRAT